MIKDKLKEKILKNTIKLDSFGMNDLTWEKETAKNLIISLLPDNIGILGGSVYKIDAGKFIPLYDNWHSLPDKQETQSEFDYRSKMKALDYIENYPVYPGEKILFSLVFTDDVD